MTYDPHSPPPLQYATPAPPARPGFRPRHLFGWVLFLGLAVFLFMLLQNRPATAARPMPLSEFATRLETNEITRIVLDGDTLTGDYVPSTAQPANSPPRHFHTTLPPGTGQSWAFAQWLLANRGPAEITVRNQNNYLVNILLPVIPWLLIFAFIWFFVFRQLRKAAIAPPPTIITGPGRWVPDPPHSPLPTPHSVQSHP